MSDRVVVDVIDMAGEVGVVADLMLPIAMLPDGLLAPRQARRVGCAPEYIGAMLGEAGLDQPPAGREVDIARRQCPDAVQVIGHHDDGVDLERA